MTAGSDTGNGAASALTDRSGCSARRMTIARRVGSDSAAKVRSRLASENLTIWFSIKPSRAESTAVFGGFNDKTVRLRNPIVNRRRNKLCRMEPASLATAIVGAQTGMLQLAVAARLERMNADEASSVVKLIDAGEQSASSLANVAAGLGANLDITA
jgi:hypothetical protein